MISVEDAVSRIRAAFAPLSAETISLEKAVGRVLAEDVVAKFGQPPFPVSSMDGFAVRAADATRPGSSLRVIGAAPAGHPYSGQVTPGCAVRIFTGSVVPEGADSIVIQENANLADGVVTLNVAATAGQHIRRAGLDFAEGAVLVRSGSRLTARHLALIAAGDQAEVTVHRKPKIVVAATGDELSLPGSPRKPGGIVASSGFALGAMIDKWGGVIHDLGILPDTSEAVASIADHAGSSELVVTIGGASVGDYDLVQSALAPKGFELDFWKIAMRPGKPLIFGRIRNTPLLGLPGNPVSTLVCALLFLKPAIFEMTGATDETQSSIATLSGELRQNDTRQDYVRARLYRKDGEQFVEPFVIQDSSMLSSLARADALIIRPPHASAAHAGDRVPILHLE